MGPLERCEWRLAAALLAGVMTIAAAGCEGTPKSVDGGQQALARPQVEPGAAADVDAATQERLARAERDVQQYLKQREQAGAAPAWTDDAAFASGGHVGPEALRRSGSGSGSGSGGADELVNAGHTPRQQVIFNDSPGGDDGDGRPRTEGDSVEPSPLFRDATQAPAVNEFGDGAAAQEASLRPDRLRQLMVDLRRELYIEGAHSDQPLRQLLPIAALSMLDPEAAINPEAVPDLTSKERELLGALQAFFAGVGARLAEGTDVEEAIATGVRELREAVIKEPRLTLPALALCHRVDGYGKYERFSVNRFLAHSVQQVIVYVEVDDFTSEVNDAGEWVTQLSQQITIYSDRDGIPVWRSGDMQTAIDKARNQRHDFFLLQIITIPGALSVGKYHLKVRVRDEKSGAEAEGAVEFEMVADPKLAATMP